MLSKPTRQTNLSPSPHFLSPFPDKKRQPLPLSKPPLHSRFSNLDYLSSLFHKTSPNHHSPSILETMSSKVSLLNISKERLSEQIKNYEFARCAVVVYTAVICVSNGYVLGQCNVCQYTVWIKIWQNGKTSRYVETPPHSRICFWHLWLLENANDTGSGHLT